MENLKNKLNELKELGFSQEQTTELLILGEQEVLEKVMEEFTTNTDENVVKEYIEKVNVAKNNQEELSFLFTEIMELLYGSQNIEAKKEEFLVEYVQNIIDLTKETKDVFQKYSDSDPETVSQIQQAQNDPSVQKVTQKMKEDKDKGLY